MLPKNIKKKMGSVIEPQKVDQDPILGTTSNIDSGNQLSPSAMSISEQSAQDNEVSRPADNEKVVASQPPKTLFPYGTSSPMANYAARKLEKSTALGTGPTIVRNNHDEEGVHKR
ncbi:hypothetical protein GGU11DRAFT_760918 [Lentinula aff. detonsa]|nr:hypothetical protein GGU11DRAFT_760918 [Lentinula aff. detonsa]